MATSGTTVLSITRDELITQALRKLTVLSEGQSASATQLASAAATLNNLISTYQTLGMFLWKRIERTIPFVAGQKEYVLGVGEAINTAYPLKVLQAIVSCSGGTQVDMEIIAHHNYNLLPTAATGIPIKGTYLPQNDVGIFTVWPIPDSSAAANNELVLTYQKPFDIFTSGTDTADFPREWYNALIYGLADLLSDEFGLPLDDRRHLEKKAEKMVAAAVSAGTEETSTFFYPDRRE